jgi:peroxiredoxin
LTIDTGVAAPAFTLPALDGGALSLPGDAAGLPVLLVFFRVSCDTCDLAFPYINRLREAYPGGWHLWAVSQDTAERSVAYRDRLAITVPVLVDDPGLAVSRAYDPPSTPALFLIAPEGGIEYVSEGFAKADLNEISARLAARLGVAAVEVAPADDGNPAMKPGCMARHLFPPRR